MSSYRIDFVEGESASAAKKNKQDQGTPMYDGGVNAFIALQG
jgi:hypothetical protein